MKSESGAGTRTTMRAGVLLAPGRIQISEHPMPRAQPGGLTARVRVALTDGTDLKAFRRGHPKMAMPTLFGHEFSGDVVSVGEGVTAFKPGDAIASVHSAPCDACFWCEHEQEELCERVMDTKILGAYAEYIAIPKHIVERNAFAKPQSLSYEAAAFLEPLSCVVHSLRHAGIERTETVLILGAGGFGILHAAAARALGVPRVLLAGRAAMGADFAAHFGFEYVAFTHEDALLAFVGECTAGRGADLVIECTGTPSVWEAAPSYARRGGTASLFGGLPPAASVAFDAGRLHYDQVRIVSPFHFTPRAVREAFALLVSGSIDPRPLISDTFSLERLPEAFAALDDRRGIKYAVVP
jgi:L-iditol 2-dehydrogenase